jgi:hypothetical protein
MSTIAPVGYAPTLLFRRVIRLLFVATATLAVCGCHTTEPARKSAAALASELDDYRREQEQRLDDINRRYRFDYAQLIAEVTRLRHDQLNQFFNLGSMEATAQILTDWENATLPKRIRDRVAESVEERRLRLLAVDKQIDDARRAYADAYQGVQLNVGQLKAAQSATAILAVPEDRRRTTVEFIQTVARVYQKLRDEAKSAPEKSNP